MANPRTKTPPPTPRKPTRTSNGARISAGSVWLLWAVAAGVGALFLFASIVSFAGLYQTASWLGLPPYLYWAFPLAVDLAIVIYKTAEIVLRYDPRKKSKVKKAVLGTVLFTIVSSAGNVVHVVSLANPIPLEFWGGIIGAGLMPWAVYLSASVLTDLIVKPLHVHVDTNVSRETLTVEMTEPIKVAPRKPAPKRKPKPPFVVKAEEDLAASKAKLEEVKTIGEQLGIPAADSEEFERSVRQFEMTSTVDTASAEKPKAMDEAW